MSEENNNKLLKRIKEIIEIILSDLKKADKYGFTNNPSAEVFYKKDFIGVSLVDDDNTQVVCKLSQNPRKGLRYIYFKRKELMAQTYLSLAKLELQRIIYEIDLDNAYNTNLRRVDDLIKDKYYAIALVFLVSAFENTIREIFFFHHSKWFTREMINHHFFDEEVYKKIGKEIEADNDKESEYFEIREVNSQLIGISATDLEKADSWQSIVHWSRIYRVCRSLGIYNDYVHKVIANKGVEIGYYEILKDMLTKRRVLNFQGIYKKPNLVWLFKKFYNLDLKLSFQEELDIIRDGISKRHELIHATLKEEEITKEYVEKFKSAILNFIEFLKAKLRSLYLERYGPVGGNYIKRSR